MGHFGDATGKPLICRVCRKCGACVWTCKRDGDDDVGTFEMSHFIIRNLLSFSWLSGGLK